MRPRIRAFSVLALVFVAGVATGGLLARAWVQHAATSLLDAPPDRLVERLVIFRIDQEVKLTREQKLRIGDIVRQGRQRTALVRQRIYPELAAEWRSQARQITEVLTPEQRPVFDRLAADWNARARILSGLPADHPDAPDGGSVPR